MGTWRWDRSNMFEGDARIAQPVDPEPQGGLPNFKPPLKARENAPKEDVAIPLYQEAEAHVFNFLCADHGGGVPPRRLVKLTAGDGQLYTQMTNDTDTFATRVTTVGMTCVYLYELLIEDRRPSAWLSRAEVKLRELADYLLSWQIGSPTQSASLTAALTTTPASTHAAYGAICSPSSTTLAFPSPPFATVSAAQEEVVVGGLALLRAYQILGDQKYRSGYQAALLCLRRMQCGGKLTSGYFVNYGSSTSRLADGPWASFVVTLQGTFTGYTNTTFVHSLMALEFLTAVKDFEGDTTYGDATAVGSFALDTAATLSTQIAQAKAWWENGAFDRRSGTVEYGLTISRPQTLGLKYNIGSNTLGASNFSYWSDNSGITWTTGNSNAINMHRIVRAMRGWIKAFGLDSRMQGLWDYFMASEQDPRDTVEYWTGRSQWNNRQAFIWYTDPAGPLGSNGWDNIGTYDTTQTWAQFVVVWDGTAATNVADYNLSYDWKCVGLLSFVWATQEPTGFTEAKEQLSTSVPRHVAPTIRDPVRIWKSLGGTSGYSYQPYDRLCVNGSSTNNTLFYDAYAAACCGLVYRQQPKIYAVMDHPAATTGTDSDASIGSTSGTTSSSGVLAHWTFSDGSGATTAADSSGNGHDGTYSGSVTPGVTAAAFSGGRVTVPSGTSMLPRSAITIEALFTWNGPSVIEQRIIEKSVGGSNGTQPLYGIQISSVSNTPRFELWVGSGAISLNTATTITIGQPTHVVATYDGAAMRIYVNGVEVAFSSQSGSIAGSLSAADVSANIGIGNQVEREKPLSGSIDELIIYSTALSAAQIAANAVAYNV